MWQWSSQQILVMSVFLCDMAILRTKINKSDLKLQEQVERNFFKVKTKFAIIITRTKITFYPI
jgi:hypothetical protein